MIHRIVILAAVAIVTALMLLTGCASLGGGTAPTRSAGTVSVTVRGTTSPVSVHVNGMTASNQADKPVDLGMAASAAVTGQGTAAGGTPTATANQAVTPKPVAAPSSNVAPPAAPSSSVAPAK